MKQKQGRCVVIGAGFAGLSAACILARHGHEVVVLEKNEAAGGRARTLKVAGYVFDMGPSWYWMPDVFTRFFAQFGKSPSDFYRLLKLDPAFVIHWKEKSLVIPASLDDIFRLFDREEPDGGIKLKSFLTEAETKYNIAFSDFIYKPSASIMEFTQVRFLSFLFRLSLFSSYHSYVRKYFSNPFLIQLLEFPVLFLGGSPHNIPGMYSLMSHAAFTLGTWYPQGGFSQVVNGIVRMSEELGVKIHLSEPVQGIRVHRRRATEVVTTKGTYECDVVVNTSDYAHAEQMLEKKYRNYDNTYWSSRVFSPSCLIFYVGVTKRLPGLQHHNLFFDASFSGHVRQIYDSPQWPDNPLFYVCCPSRTDATVAPPGHENLFILMPVASGIEDAENIRIKYFDLLLDRLERRLGESIRPYIDFSRSYCVRDFVSDYNACKGNAYGLANTLRQTAFLKPSLKNAKIKNLFYAGQLTVPGPGVPPAIISGQIAATVAADLIKSSLHETVIR